MNRPVIEVPKTDRPILDLHVHVGPEFLTRRYDIETLAEEAQREATNIFQS